MKIRKKRLFLIILLLGGLCFLWCTQGFCAEEMIRVFQDNEEDTQNLAHFVFITGAVNKPGKIFIKDQTIDVREALIKAGLPVVNASLTKAILTRAVDNMEKIIDLRKILYEGHLHEKIILHSGDKLHIPFDLIDILPIESKPIKK